MMVNEIGGEFQEMDACENKNIDFFPKCEDFILAFSGRTAIENVLLDIGTITGVAFPSYCCKSMVEPFSKYGIRIKFYDVVYEKGIRVNLDIPTDCNVLLWCNYFGFDIDFPQKEIGEFQKKGGIVIEDITHSFLSYKQYNLDSDYLVASLRKWGALISGGYCGKRKGKFSVTLNKTVPLEFVQTKFSAMHLKREYLVDGDEKKKTHYLELFSKSNEWIEKNYSGIKIDKLSKRVIQSMDVIKIRDVRKQNAKILYEGLRNLMDIVPLFELKKMDCPLFIPIIIKNGKRDIIRHKLIDEKIYCPIHWPCSIKECNSNIYDNSLSLLCDQRYSEKDMKRIIEVLSY